MSLTPSDLASTLQTQELLDSTIAFEIGDVQFFPKDHNPGANYIKLDGSTYLQAEYPELFSALGHLLDMVQISRTTPETPHDVGVAAYSPSLERVAYVGDVGNRYYSDDGISWSAGTSSSVLPTTNMIWSPSRNEFYYMSSTDYHKSSDGITWTTGTLPTEAQSCERVKWIEDLGIYIAVGSDKIATSSDGITWTAQTPPHSSIGWKDIAWSPKLGRAVIVGDTGVSTTTSGVAYSDDGINWTSGPLNLGAESVTWSSDAQTYMTFEYSSSCFLSKDGVSWEGTFATTYTWGVTSVDGVTPLITYKTYRDLFYSFSGKIGEWYRLDTVGTYYELVYAEAFNMVLAFKNDGIETFFGTLYDDTTEFKVHDYQAPGNLTAYIKAL